jgi:L-evernosamine nitrososynthase
MAMELQATTAQGKRLVSMAEELAERFAADAAVHDREGTFPYENLEVLKERGYLYAPIPRAFGGLGVSSVRDLYIASSRLARGDPSITIGVNMHLMSMVRITRNWRMARESGDLGKAASIAETMKQITRDREVIAAAISERSQDLTRQSTVAHCSDSACVIEGTKIIASMAPAATRFAVSMTLADEQDGDRYAFAMLPRDTPGLTVHDDWDALGMRASASSSITFDKAPLADTAIGETFPAGRISAGLLDRWLTSGLAHASASVGIAEQAHRLAVKTATAKCTDATCQVRPTITHLAAENALDLASLRAVFDRALRLIDDHYATHPRDAGSLEELHQVFSEGQSAKTVVTQAALRVVDRAMAIAGGGAYMSGHPLSRLWRDVRAGGFMNPLGTTLAYEYLGATSLGLQPERF